ncbi:MAG: hypothetical protein CXT68_05650 [Methanobacteriota archaeon]|nr:MAG: hypothetical protein CXT68_05650 [Euryarchaeota archaeon]
MSIGVNGAASKNIRVMITHGVLDALGMLVKTRVPRNPLIGLRQRGPLGPRKAIRCFNAKTSFEENGRTIGDSSLAVAL